MFTMALSFAAVSDSHLDKAASTCAPRKIRRHPHCQEKRARETCSFYGKFFQRFGLKLDFVNTSFALQTRSSKYFFNKAVSVPNAVVFFLRLLVSLLLRLVVVVASKVFFGCHCCRRLVACCHCGLGLYWNHAAPILHTHEKQTTANQNLFY